MNYKFLSSISIIILFAIQVPSQEINQDFLNSLPDDIREDVLKEINIQNNKPIKNYNAFTSSIPRDNKDLLAEDIHNPDFQGGDKNIYSEDLLKNKFYISRANIIPFGQGFFRNMPTTFMPINDPSAAGDYYLGIDDKLYIQIISDSGIDDIFIIGRDGSISLPSIGLVTVAGLTLDQAREVISSKAKKTFLDSKVYVSLTEIRDIQITVLGEVMVPGIYTLNGYSNILNALNSAGGLKQNGSLRKVTITRGKNKINIDLYDLFIFQDSLDYLSLRSGDIINVEPVSNSVFIHGGVNRPGIYEFSTGDNIQNILRLANGYTDLADTGFVQVQRFTNGDMGVKQVLSDKFEDFLLKPGDELFIPFYDNLLVSGIRLMGAFRQPGIYSQKTFNKNSITPNFEGYDLAIFHGKRDSNGQYLYSANAKDDFQDIPILDSDILIYLKQSELEFLNSYLFQEYINEPFLSDCKNFNIFIRDISRSDLDYIKALINNSSESIKPLSENDIKTLFNEECSGLLDYPNLASLITSIFKASVHLNGDLNNNGFFPIPNSLGLKKLLLYTGNFDTNLTKLAILSKRRKLNSSYSTISDDLIIQQSDKVTLVSNKKNDEYFLPIKVRGAVNNPGTYYISGPVTLYNFIQDIGGLRQDAYSFGGVLIRPTAIEIESKYNERLYQDAIKALASLSTLAKGIDFSSIPLILQEFKSISPIGRITIDFERNESSSLVLPGDEIFIPTFEPVVRVFGEVVNPGTVAYSSSQSAEEYIKRAGGYTSFSDLGSIIAISPNGEAKVIKQGLFSRSPDIYPGSVIYVPRDTKSLDGLEFAAAISPIVSSLALSLASLNSIRN